MKLPNRNKATIPQEKLTGYLLSKTHPQGAPKAKLLRRWGFNENNTHALKQELQKIAQIQDIIRSSRNPYGTNYVIDGTINTPKGKNKRIRTIWFIAQNEIIPSLVTITFK